MLNYSTIVLNWTGKQLTGEQVLVLQRAAELFPEPERKDAAYLFEHPLCEGLLTCKGRATVGTFSGVAFHAHLGTAGGDAWTHEFILKDGFHEADLPPDTPMHLIETKRGVAPIITPVDIVKSKGVKVTRLRRQ